MYGNVYIKMYTPPCMSIHLIMVVAPKRPVSCTFSSVKQKAGRLVLSDCLWHVTFLGTPSGTAWLLGAEFKPRNEDWLCARCGIRTPHKYRRISCSFRPLPATSCIGAPCADLTPAGLAISLKTDVGSLSVSSFCFESYFPGLGR